MSFVACLRHMIKWPHVELATNLKVVFRVEKCCKTLRKVETGKKTRSLLVKQEINLLGKNLTWASENSSATFISQLSELLKKQD